MAHMKSVKELVFGDLGKEVVLKESNGDRNSGSLGTITYGQTFITLVIGGDQIHPDLDAEIEFVDE